MKRGRRSGVTSRAFRRWVVGAGLAAGLVAAPPAANRPPLEAARARAENRHVTVKASPEAHLFIKAITGNPSEYPSLEQVFVRGLLDDLRRWMKTQLPR